MQPEASFSPLATRKRLAWQTGQPLPINANWTGQNMCPLENLFGGANQMGILPRALMFAGQTEAS